MVSECLSGNSSSGSNFLFLTRY